MTNTQTTRSADYRIVRACELRSGDVIRTTFATVKTVEVGTENTTVNYRNGNMGVVRNDTRVGVYRRTQ